MEETHKAKAETLDGTSMESVTTPEVPGETQPNISENPAERKKRIKELSAQIHDTLEQQTKIKKFQELYKDIPDDALTESDLATKQTSVESLQKELAMLKQKEGMEGSGTGGVLKKIASFLSF